MACHVTFMPLWRAAYLRVCLANTPSLSSFHLVCGDVYAYRIAKSRLSFKHGTSVQDAPEAKDGKDHVSDSEVQDEGVCFDDAVTLAFTM